MEDTRLPSISELNLPDHIYETENLNIPYISQIQIIKKLLAKHAGYIKNTIKANIYHDPTITEYEVIQNLCVDMHNHGIFIDIEYLLKILH